MLINLNEKQQFYDNFNYFFQRNNKLSVFLNINFVELLRSKDIFPENFINNESQILKNLFRLELVLVGNGSDTLNKEGNYTKLKFNNHLNINLFDDEISTYYCHLDISGIKGKYKIVGRIKYNYSFYDYISSQSLNDLLEPEERSKFIKYKLTIDENSKNFYHTSNGSISFYDFESDYIDIDPSCYISNLYDIYNFIIKFDDYKDFITTKNSEYGTEYDGKLPAVGFYYSTIDQKQRNNKSIVRNKKNNIFQALKYDFSQKSGDVSSYQKLMMNLIQNRVNSLDYKEYCSINNIFKYNSNYREENQFKTNLKTFERINSNFESGLCDKNLFSNSYTSNLEDSEILLVSSFLKEIENLDINEFWINDFTLIPVYLLGIKAEFKVSYIKTMNKKSLSYTWQDLTNSELENLKPGRYLCKITSKERYVSNFIMENYFILEK